MTANRCFKVLLSGALVLAVLAGVSLRASAQNGTATSPGPKWEENQQGPMAVGDQDQTRDRTRDQMRDQTPVQIRGLIQDRIRNSQNLTVAERVTMEANLEACLRSGVTDPELETVFPGSGKARQISTQTMLQLQTRLRAMAQEGMPVEPVLAKVREAQMKGVPDAGLAQVCERVGQHVREAKRIMTQAKADGIQPAPDARRERQMIREMAQQMWRGTAPEDMDALRTRARDRLRTRTCTMEDLIATSETATRLREEGVEARRAIRITSEALQQGYGAQEMRRLQYMMIYRHREGRAVKGLVDDFEHCLGAGMDSGHMYQYMMQHGWMGPGDVQGPGGSRPIDDQGRGLGTPGGGTGKGPGTGGPKRGQ
jgi:hypothetical protein